MSKYITESEATTYFDSKVNADAWDAASSSERDKALKNATKIIDRLNFVGKRPTDQDLAFPRDFQDSVPQEVKDACAEIALSLLDGVDPDFEFENLNMNSFSLGGARTQYNKEVPPPHILAGVPSPTAWRLLLRFIRNPRDIKLTRV